MNCSTETSQPKSPRRSVRRPKTGAPSGPSARRVAGPARPSATSPARRWNAFVARNRLRPGDRVDRAVVEPVCAQGDLETRDLRVPGVRGRCQREPRQQGRRRRRAICRPRADQVRAAHVESCRDAMGDHRRRRLPRAPSRAPAAGRRARGAHARPRAARRRRARALRRGAARRRARPGRGRAAGRGRRRARPRGRGLADPGLARVDPLGQRRGHRRRARRRARGGRAPRGADLLDRGLRRAEAPSDRRDLAARRRRRLRRVEDRGRGGRA